MNKLDFRSTNLDPQPLLTWQTLHSLSKVYVSTLFHTELRKHSQTVP